MNPHSTVRRLAQLLACLAALGAAAARADEKAGDGAYAKVGFDKLAAFNFNAEQDAATATDPEVVAKGNAQIPEAVRAFDTKKVAVTGFMLPVKMEEGLVKEFLLVKDPMMCCYGVMPRINEWIVVRMTGKGVQPLMDTPITFYGKLRVGQMFENGYLTGIYLLEGDRMADTKG